MWLLATLALCIIALGCIIGLTQLALPWIASHPEKISAWLSDRLHRPVVIDRVDTRWQRSGPLLTLTGLHLGAAGTDGQPFDIASAGLKINFFAWARHNASWTEFRVAGVELDLARDAAGKWRLRGMDTTNRDAPGAATPATPGTDTAHDIDDSALFGLGTLVLRDVRLNIDDQPNAQHFKLAAPELRLINSGNLHRAFARVKNLETPSTPVDAILEYNTDDHSGRAYLGGTALDLAVLLHGYPLQGIGVNRGIGRAQFWAWFTDGSVNEARAEVELTDLVLTTQTPIVLDAARNVVPHVGFDRVVFSARWQHEADGWSADIADLGITRQDFTAPQGRLHLQMHIPASIPDPNAALVTREVSANGLDFSAISSVAMLSDALPAAVRRWIYIANPDGTLARSDVRFVDVNDFDFSAEIDALAVHPSDKLPGVRGLAAHVRGDQQAVDFELPQHVELSLAAPRAFRQSFEFSELSGDLVAYREDASWRVATDAMNFEGSAVGKSFAGEVRGFVELPDDGRKPSLDVAALLRHADVQSSHLFWPTSMSANAVTWLDRALDGGRITEARATFRGDLGEWPFRAEQGRFDAHAIIDELRLKYFGDWPALEHAHAVADFVNTGVHVDIDGGSVLANRIGKGSVDISDYGEGTLDIALGAQGNGHDLLNFVKATPLGNKFATPLQGVDVTGRAKIDLTLRAPMKPLENFVLEGNVELAEADLIDTKFDLKFDNASGALRFNRNGFIADALDTTFHARPAKFSLLVGDFVGDRQHGVEVKIDTRLPVGDVLDYAPALAVYKKYTSGESNWNALFSVDRDVPDGTGQRLTLISDLRGVGIDMPRPLAKSSASSLPLKLVLTLPFIGADLDMRLGDILRMHGRLPTPTAPFAALVDFGDNAAQLAGATLPKSGMVIGGHARAVDMSGWIDFVNSAPASSGGDSVLNHIDLRADALIASERSLGAGALRLNATSDALDFAFDGANIDGTLRVPRNDLHRLGIVADFVRLYWPQALAAETPLGADPAAIAAAEADDEAEAMYSSVNPGAIPPLHIKIADFKLGKVDYGKAVLETAPFNEGMRFEKLTTHSKDIDMKAHGEWVRRDGSSRSTFGIDLSAANLGHMLEAFGNAGLIDGGKTIAHIDASWAGPPSAFALNRINGGALKVSIGSGNIPDIQLGAGKIAGLLNLAAIPRRLAFDFGDLFNKGYSFDSIAGTFTLTDGYAYTENLEVKSPTADLRLKGSMGLKTRDWDQIVEVTPHVGGSLAVGGALIGGPVGAAAGVVLQTLFKNQINAVTRADYKVNGSWDKPNIVKIATINGATKKTTTTPQLRDGGR